MHFESEPLADATFTAMGFDFVILIFTTVALLERRAAKTGLWKLIFQDGLVYFMVSFTMNAIPAVRSRTTPLASVALIASLNRSSIC